MTQGSPLPPVSTESLVEYFTGETSGRLVSDRIRTGRYRLLRVLWTTRSTFAAMAWPLVVLGAFELVVGTAIVMRTPGQVATLERGLRIALVDTSDGETTRVAAVNSSFRMVKRVEAGFRP